MHYRKKPIVVEAWELPDPVVDRSNAPKFILNALLSGKMVAQENGNMLIHTLEGPMMGSVDDYIIQGVKGEIYPCKPDIFHATYDQVVEE